MEDNSLHEIALTLIPGIGAVQAKQLVNYFGNAKAVFTAKKKELSALEGIGEIKAKAIKDWNNFKTAEEELSFCEKHHIKHVFLTHTNYPQRLLHCYDAPTVLYYRGNTDLNATKVISIIGTRSNSNYGKEITEKIITAFADMPVLIVSGLAFGIDAIAHKAALQNNLPTIGVLAHGLNSIYPSQHKSLAKEMLLNGGLITEFRKNVKADKHNFPKRNRIVAGMSDATIVVETQLKGGSMITAELANNYNRDVFAVPGKVTDAKSCGCLKLIQQNKAILFYDTEHLLQELGLQQKKSTPKKQKELFIDLTDDEKVILNILQQKTTVQIDEIYLQSGLSSSTVAACILNMELQNIIQALPGKKYQLL